jgi:hypothetical protein
MSAIFKLGSLTWPNLPAGVTPQWIRLQTVRTRVAHAGTWTAKWVSDINAAAPTVYATDSWSAGSIGSYETVTNKLQAMVSRAAMDAPTFGLILTFTPASPSSNGNADLDQLVLQERHTVAGTISGVDEDAYADIPDQYVRGLTAVAAVYLMEGAPAVQELAAWLARYDATAAELLNSWRTENRNAQTSERPRREGRYSRGVY